MRILLQVLLVQRQGDPLAEGAEARDGVTPAMRDARRRLFRRPLKVSPDLLRRVEEDILTVAAVRAGPAALLRVMPSCVK